MTLPALSVVIVALAAGAGCRGAPADGGACHCTPQNQSRTRLADGSYLDSAALLARLRRHQRDVAQRPPGRDGRDLKMFDDELRLELTNYCQPCGDWVGDRMTIDEMFPLDRLDDAVGGVCMGLVLRDGTTVYGNARPRACR